MTIKKILIISAIILSALFLYSTPLHGQLAKTLCEIRPGFHYTKKISPFKTEKKYLCTNNSQPPGTCSPGASCTN